MSIKQLIFFVALLTTANCFAQTERKVSSTLLVQANHTLYDRTATNNSGGIGFGLQTSINSQTFVQPVLGVTADLFAGTKEMYMTINGKEIEAKSGILGIYAGGLLRPSNRLLVTATGGVSFFNGDGYFGLRSSLGYYLSQNKRVTAKASFTHIFQRDEISNEAFGYASVALGVKLF